MSAVEEAIKHIYPLVYEFRKEKSPEDLAAMQLKKERHLASIRAAAHEPDDDFDHAHLVIDEFQDAVNDENSGDGDWDWSWRHLQRRPRRGFHHWRSFGTHTLTRTQILYIYK